MASVNIETIKGDYNLMFLHPYFQLAIAQSVETKHYLRVRNVHSARFIDIKSTETGSFPVTTF